MVDLKKWRTNERHEEDHLNGITSVAEQESNLSLIQSQPKNLGGKYVQLEAVTLSLSLQPHHSYSDLHTHTHTQLIYSSHTTHLEIGCLGLVHCEPH